ncbi:MAG: CoA pyrophosphatase [Veillonellales bacterium]
MNKNMNNFYNRLSRILASREAVKDGVEGSYFSAAVLVPIVEKDGEPAVLFEVRSSRLHWQPGEICFPGGKVEPGDSSRAAAAVRETSEELGVAAGHIKLAGGLPEMISPIGVALAPFVGWIEGGTEMRLNSAEVVEIFTVPLTFLLTASPKTAAMELATKPVAGFPYALLPAYPNTWRHRRIYEVLFYQYEQYVIWGLTARVLSGFLKICRQEN